MMTENFINDIGCDGTCWWDLLKENFIDEKETSKQ